MDTDSIMAVFNAVMGSFGPLISVVLGVAIAGTVIMFLIKRLS